ncbi:unnamed protein product [Cercospora beticola]|nr:unnamed protein product [Cercospora beticola]
MSDANSESLTANNPTATSDADSMRGSPFQPTVPGFKDGFDWEDLMHYQREYIRGELAEAPYCDKPFSAEMSEWAADLEELADCGILAVQFQLASNEPPGPNAKADCTERGFVHSKRRACLKFFMPTSGDDYELESVNSSLMYLQRDDYCYHTAIRLDYSSSTCGSGDGCCYLTPWIWSNFPAEWETRTRACAETLEDLREKTAATSKQVHPYCRAKLNILQEHCILGEYEPVIVTLLAKDYESIGFFKTPSLHREDNDFLGSSVYGVAVFASTTTWARPSPDPGVPD